MLAVCVGHCHTNLIFEQVSGRARKTGAFGSTVNFAVVDFTVLRAVVLAALVHYFPAGLTSLTVVPGRVLQATADSALDTILSVEAVGLQIIPIFALSARSNGI